MKYLRILAMAALFWGATAPLIARSRDGETKGMARVLASLPAEERARYNGAQKLAAHDPAMVAARTAHIAAREKLHATLKSTLLQYDPSLAPIWDKLQGPKDTLLELKTLPANERAKWLAAREATGTQPPLQQAEADARECLNRFRELQRAALLRVDPGIGPVLAKVDALLNNKPARRR